MNPIIFGVTRRCARRCVDGLCASMPRCTESRFANPVGLRLFQTSTPHPLAKTQRKRRGRGRALKKGSFKTRHQRRRIHRQFPITICSNVATKREKCTI